MRCADYEERPITIFQGIISTYFISSFYFYVNSWDFCIIYTSYLPAVNEILICKKYLKTQKVQDILFIYYRKGFFQ